MSSDVAANIVTTATEAAFSAFQTSQAIFHWEYDESSGLSAEDFFSEEISVFVEFAFCPYILDIQKLISDKSSGAILSDILVRAVVPCIISLPVIEVSAVSYDVEDLIRKAIYDYINFTSIGQPVRVDDLIVAIRSVSGVRAVDSSIRIFGKIYCPNGEMLQSASDSVLSVPLDSKRGVSPTNSSFFINYSQINVSTTLVP